MPNTILIFDRIELSNASSVARPLAARGKAEVVTKASAQSVEVLASNLADFVGGLQIMFAKAAAVQNEFLLETVEVEASVTAAGQFGLLGNGLNVEGSTGFKLTFKRKS